MSNLDFNREQFNKVKDMCKMAKTKYSKKEGSKEKCVPVSDFMNRKKMGCKRYRKMLTGEIENYCNLNLHWALQKCRYKWFPYYK